MVRPEIRTEEEDNYILQHYKVDLTIAQIAKHLGLTTSQVSSRYKVIVTRKKEETGDYEEPESEYNNKRENKITLPYVSMEHLKL